jgi:hypothetical protein
MVDGEPPQIDLHCIEKIRRIFENFTRTSIEETA